MELLSRSLLIKQAILTLTLAIVLSLISTTLQMLEGISSEKKQIDRFFNEVMTLVDKPLTETLFRLDNAFSKQQLDSLLLNPNISRVEVIDESGAMILSGQSVAKTFSVSQFIANKLFPDISSYQKSLTLDNPFFRAGTLIIWPEKRALAEHFLNRHISILIHNLIKDFLLVLIISLFFYFLITYPLKRLTMLLSAIGDDLDNPFPKGLSRRHQYDEFGRLYDSFAHLWQTLKGTMEKLEQSHNHSTAIIENAADGILLLDQNLNIVFLNVASRRMLGESASHWLNVNVDQLLDEKTFSALQQHINKMPANTPLKLETCFDLQGKKVSVEIHLVQFNLQGQSEILLLMRDVSERLATQEYIHQLAYYDVLTTLPNRQLLIDNINDYLKHECTADENGALIIIDLDRFNTINDALGHNVGDKLLVRVAQELSLLEREGITLYRIGGDEFAFLLTHLGSRSKVENFIHVFSRKILVLCASSQEIEQYSMHISASMGVAVFANDDIEASSIIRQADTALYRAKESGRNTYVMYENTMLVASDLRLEQEKALHRAMELGLFELYYQPQVDNLGSLVGAEALIRWNDEERGFIPPDEFIPLAEELGLIVDIGAWVMDSAFSQVSKWLADGVWMTHWRMSINVSPIQFQQSDFLSILKEKIAKYQLPTSCIDLEITENMLLTDLNLCLEKMHDIQQLGVHLSVDDFGTGYSSLKYLKMLPINRLKIDQSFIRDLLNDKGDEAIVYSIIALAKAFNVSVLAEGVETVEQFERLQEIGCYYYQGYLFSRPVSSSQFVHECVHGLKVN